MNFLFHNYRFRSDHNEDNTIEIVNTWLLEISAKYHHVDFKYTTSEKLRQTEQSPLHWPTERHLDVIRLKEEGLYVGRKNWADYIFVNYINIIFFYHICFCVIIYCYILFNLVFRC